VGEYRFFIEADADISSEKTREMLDCIRENTLECKLIGAYSQGKGEK
jgi:prephenate dehydratase